MKRLIVLSDLWGKSKSDWFVRYETILKNEFEIVFYDSCELGDIDLSDSSEDRIHQQFAHEGIERAVNKLLENKNVNFTP